MSTAQREDAIPYDVPDVELGHVDSRCSFESIIVKYGLEDKALKRLAQIVHGADVAADRDNCPEAAGLYAIAHGFALVYAEDDHRKIELESPMYDALYAWCQRQVARDQWHWSYQATERRYPHNCADILVQWPAGSNTKPQATRCLTTKPTPWLKRCLLSQPPAG